MIKLYLRKIMASVLAVSIINACSMGVVAANYVTRMKTRERPAWAIHRVSGESFHRLVAGAVSREDLKLVRSSSDEDETHGTETKRWNTLENLLGAQVITKTEYDALKAAMAMPSVRAEGLGVAKQNNPFSRFVGDGIISGETSQNIMEYLMARRNMESTAQ